MTRETVRGRQDARWASRRGAAPQSGIQPQQNGTHFSICRRPTTRTEPGTHTRDLSLRSTSVHIVSSDSSFLFVKISLIRSASSSAVAPRRMVPLMGHVSTRMFPPAYEYVVSQRTWRAALGR